MQEYHFMYLGKVLRSYQNWSRVFVCKGTVVSKELIHKKGQFREMLAGQESLSIKVAYQRQLARILSLFLE